MRSREPLTGRVLVIEPDAGQAALYTDLLRTNCPGLRVDVAPTLDGPFSAVPEVVPHAVVVTCAEPSPGLDALRRALTAFPSSAVLALVAPDYPVLADEALIAGASDALLRAPGYLEQLPVTVRKNVRAAHARANADARLSALLDDLASARNALAQLKRDSSIQRPQATPQVTVVPSRRSVLRLVAAA